MDLKKLEVIKAKAKGAHTQYDLNDAVINLIDELIEHEKANELKFAEIDAKELQAEKEVKKLKIEVEK